MVGDEMHSTVLKVHNLELRNEYTYNYENTIKLSDYPEFDDMDAISVLCMCGQDRIDRNTYERTKPPYYMDKDGNCYVKKEKDGYPMDETIITPHTENFADSVLERLEPDNSRIEAIKKMRKALTKLTDKQKEVLYLSFQKEMTQEAIAEILGIKRTSVQDRLDGALKKLRKSM